jgi:two-component system chemotaxis response regulator CheB
VTAAEKIRVLVADRSVVDRERMIAAISRDPALQVVGEAARDTALLELAGSVRPDVIVLGTRISVSGDSELVREIMVEAPTRIVVALDESDTREIESSVLALRAGALAAAPRPRPPHHDEAGASTARFLATIKDMAAVKVVRQFRSRVATAPSSPAGCVDASPRAIAIAASTGGPAALHQLLSDLPADFPVPILVVQHIAGGFVDGLAGWLDERCTLTVKVAEESEPLLPRTVYVAPDDRHLGVAGRSRVLLSGGPPIEGFRPSATFLFESVAHAFGAASVHVILTGMGQDGVVGLKAACTAGAKVIAQDEASSVVFGMPGAAIGAGLVDLVTPLAAISQELLAVASGRG